MLKNENSPQTRSIEEWSESIVIYKCWLRASGSGDFNLKLRKLGRADIMN